MAISVVSVAALLFVGPNSVARAFRQAAYTDRADLVLATGS